MITIFVIIAFILGLLVGLMVMWRWGGVSLRLPFQYGEETEALSAEAQAAVNARIATRKDRIMEAANAIGRITNDGVEDLFCISDRTASNYLRQLVDEGRLERFGAGRGTYYLPIKKQDS